MRQYDHIVQAIALSLQDSSGFLNVLDRSPSKSSLTPKKDCNVDKIKDSPLVKEDRGGRKRKKTVSFSLFGEASKESSFDIYLFLFYLLTLYSLWSAD